MTLVRTICMNAQWVQQLHIWMDMRPEHQEAGALSIQDSRLPALQIGADESSKALASRWVSLVGYENGAGSPWLSVPVVGEVPLRLVLRCV